MSNAANEPEAGLESNNLGFHGTSAKSTIIVCLFSADAKTTNQLNLLVGRIRDGLKQLSGSISAATLPTVHCLYRRPDSSDAIGYQITTATDPEAWPPPSGSGYSNSETIVEQLRAFLNDVKPGPVSRGSLHLILGAHGDGGYGFFRILRRIFSRFRTMFRVLFSRSVLNPFGMLKTAVRILFWPFPVWKPGTVIVAGDPVPELLRSGKLQLRQEVDLTLSDLRAVLVDTLADSVDSLTIHSCFMSGLEEMYELRHIKHHVACENQLGGSMPISAWIAHLAASNYSPCDMSAEFANGQHWHHHHVTGIFSSHKTIGETGNVDWLPELNQFGKELKDVIISHSRRLEQLRCNSVIAESPEECLVDILGFCQQVWDEFEWDSAKVLQATIEGFQHANIPNPGDSGPFGINVYFPKPTALKSEIDLLPTHFKRDAKCWIEFLEAWVTQ